MPKLLVIKPSSLGDIIHGLQVVQTFREQTKDWKISWVARDIFAPLVKACPTVDHVYTFQREGGVLAFLSLMRQIRAEQWDVVWDMQGLARSGLLTLAARSPVKLGRADAREFATFAYTEMIAGAQDSHALDILLEFLHSSGVKKILPKNLNFRSTGSQGITAIAKQNPIILFPESRRKEKVWPYFHSLAIKLSKLPGDQPVVWAGSDKQLAPDMDTPHFINLAGKTSLQHLPELISNAKLVVSNDSGPMHLAAAMGKPVLALFGPTDPESFGPYPIDSKRHVILRAENGDLSKLDVEAVYMACVKML